MAALGTCTLCLHHHTCTSEANKHGDTSRAGASPTPLRIVWSPECNKLRLAPNETNSSLLKIKIGFQLRVPNKNYLGGQSSNRMHLLSPRIGDTFDSIAGAVGGRWGWGGPNQLNGIFNMLWAHKVPKKREEMAQRMFWPYFRAGPSLVHGWGQYKHIAHMGIQVA